MKITTRPLEEPVQLLDHRPDLVWLSPDRELAGFGRLKVFEPTTGRDRFERAATDFAQWVGAIEVDDRVGADVSGPLLFSSFAFDESTHETVLVVPEMIVGRAGGQWFFTSTGEADPGWLYHPSGTAEAPPARPRYAGSSIPDLSWLEAVDKALDRIEGGRLEKVVLARDYAVWSKGVFEPKRVLERLHRRFPGCFVFSVNGLVGASPELLVRLIGGAVESVTLAGSARRSPDPQLDEALARALLESEKDRREHMAAAASVERVLGEVCERLMRDPEPVLLDLANLRHLATRFRGKARDAHTALELAGRLHPTAAVGGTPTDLAVQTIRELEGMNRGRYAAPVGWSNRRGEGEFAIALRCAELSGARARLFAGAGIVAGSLPEDELEETRLKLEAMLDALGT